MLETTLGQGGGKIPALVFENDAELADQLARHIAAGVRAAAAANHQYLLGCPAGRSPLPTLVKLAATAAAERMDLSHLILVMMDEYVLKTAAGFAYCAADAHYSCRRFARVEIAGRLNASLPPARQVGPDSIWFPNPANPAAHDDRIESAGSVDLFIAAVGASDFHVAFNPPGAALDSPSRVIRLNPATREDNLKTFPDFKDLSEVPEFGVSIGLNTLARLTKEIAMIINGAHKRLAANTINRLDGFDPAVPASVILEAASATAYLDRAAAADIINHTEASK